MTRRPEGNHWVRSPHLKSAICDPNSLGRAPIPHQKGLATPCSSILRPSKHWLVFSSQRARIKTRFVNMQWIFLVCFVGCTLVKREATFPYVNDGNRGRTGNYYRKLIEIIFTTQPTEQKRLWLNLNPGRTLAQNCSVKIAV